MRRAEHRRRPQVEGLEAMTLLSGATAMLPAVVAPTPAPSISIQGTAAGTYAEFIRNPDTGATYRIQAHGMLTPLGRSFVEGSLKTPGFILNGQTTGTLRIFEARGSLVLKVTGPAPRSTSSGLTDSLTYTIVSGTGRFRHAQGSGSLTVTLTPSAASRPTGTMIPAPMHGKVSLSFGSSSTV